jgi:hypothetical protein
MIKYCLKKWDQNKEKLEKVLRERTDMNQCGYKDLVEIVVTNILNDGRANEDLEFDDRDVKRISEIDDGNYEGTLLYLIPANRYQPDEEEYLMTYIGYGSCSCCDTLMHIQMYGDDNGALTDRQVKDFMTLCKDIITNMIKPYNHGWRYDAEYDSIDF